MNIDKENLTPDLFPKLTPEDNSPSQDEKTEAEVKIPTTEDCEEDDREKCAQCDRGDFCNKHGVRPGPLPKFDKK